TKKKSAAKRHTWRDSPKVRPPEWRPNVLSDQPSLQSVARTATSNWPIPLPRTLPSKPTESSTNLVDEVNHCTNSFQPGSVNCTSTVQQSLDKSNLSGQWYMSMGLDVMEKQ